MRIRIAVIVASAVENIIVAATFTDYEPAPGESTIEIPDGLPVGIGWTWTEQGGFQPG